MNSKNLVNSQGQPLTVEQAIHNLRQTDDPSLRYYAAWWLGRFRISQPDAIAALVQALDDETDRAPDGGYPLRRNAARALGKLGNLDVLPSLISCLDCSDYYVREAAVQALESLNDASCVPNLRQMLAGGVEAAVPIAGKPHLAQPYNAILEALGTLGAIEAVPEIQPFLTHERPQIQNAAARAMYQLTGETAFCEHLMARLQGDNLQLRRSALMDLGAVGYLPAADAIASTPAENSLKLIALQGILETHLKSTEYPSVSLSAEARRVMQLMDGLL